MQSKNEFAGHLFALNYILRPTRPSTSDASPRVVDFNPQRPLEHAGAGTWCMHRIWDKSQRHLSADRWTSMGPHAVHKHAALTTMFSCSFVFLFPLSLFAYLPYLLLPHPWYVRPVRKGTSDIEPGIPDSFIVQQATWYRNQHRKIWWSFFDYRGCSCLDFRRIGM